MSENTRNKGDRMGPVSLASQSLPRDEWPCQGKTMTDFSYLLFNQSPEQLRRIGARGGKAQARNRRARLMTHHETQPGGAVFHPLPEHPLPEHPLPQTATQAIAALDAQFPWLCGAE